MRMSGARPLTRPMTRPVLALGGLLSIGGLGLLLAWARVLPVSMLSAGMTDASLRFQDGEQLEHRSIVRLGLLRNRGLYLGVEQG